MKSDLSRDTFDGAKHFTRVLMQQGRVTLDADHNEQVAILLHYLWTLARDVIGPYGAPVVGGGFTLADDRSGVFTIGRGRYYVDGLLVENDKESCRYTTQPDYPLPGDDPLGKGGNQRPAGPFLAYLDVWERHVTPIEDTVIREVALGGPDTCNRAKLVWQVKVAPVPKPDGRGRTRATELKARRTRTEKALAKETTPEARKKLEEDIKAIDAELEKAARDEVSPDCRKVLDTIPTIGTGRLAARLDPGQLPPDPCVMAPESRYRGAENQLYRVEVHQPGQAGTATFKWSRDNGSVVTGWLNTAGNDLVVASSRGFGAGNWVELSDEALDLQGTPGTLVKLTKVEPGLLSVDPESVPAGATIAWPAQRPHPKVRRWDQVQIGDVELRDGAVVVEGPAPNGAFRWIDLEDGIQVRFAAPADGPEGTYRTGDYWLIPARVATGRIEWPDLETPPGDSEQPPHGVLHHHAALGFVTWNDTAKAWTVDNACRCEFPPLCGGPIPQ